MRSNPTVWLVHQEATTPETGNGGRIFYYARELARRGCSVYLIAASWHHLMSAPPDLPNEGAVHKEEIEDNLRVAWIRMRSYGNAHSRLRILSWFLFGWRLRRNAGAISETPDVIVASSPPLIGAGTAQALARRFGAESILDIRDIWPVTLEKIGSISHHNPLVMMMRHLERKAYDNADHITSNLEHARRYLEAFGVDNDRFTWLPNGVPAEDVVDGEVASDEPVRDGQSSEFVVGYAGTIGLSNALEYLVDAASLLERESSVQFVLYGDGKDRKRLERIVEERGVTNVRFNGAIEKRHVMKALQGCDALYLGWADSSLYEFGIGASKIPEYLLSGRPILHSFSGRGDPIARCAAGVTVPAGDPAAIAEGVRRLQAMDPAHRREMGARGRHYALQNLDYRVLGGELFNVIDRCRARDG